MEGKPVGFVGDCGMVEEFFLLFQFMLILVVQ